MSAGYEFHEALSRAFKSGLGKTPPEFRQQAELPDLNPPQSSLPTYEITRVRVTIQQQNKQIVNTYVKLDEYLFIKFGNNLILS